MALSISLVLLWSVSIHERQPSPFPCGSANRQYPWKMTFSLPFCSCKLSVSMKDIPLHFLVVLWIVSIHEKWPSPFPCGPVNCQYPWKTVLSIYLWFFESSVSMKDDPLPSLLVLWIVSVQERWPSPFTCGPVNRQCPWKMALSLPLQSCELSVFMKDGPLPSLAVLWIASVHKKWPSPFLCSHVNCHCSWEMALSLPFQSCELPVSMKDGPLPSLVVLWITSVHER